MPKKRPCAPQRADTRNRPWAGIPHAVLDSAAYVDLSLFARAVLVEIVRNFNGYNNGEIGVGYDHLIQRLGNQNKRKIRQAFVDLMSHGFISTETEADWKGRRTREYRLTFVNTTPSGRHKPATNDYKDWVKTNQKASVTPSPLTPNNGDTSSPLAEGKGDTSSPCRFQKLRDTAKSKNAANANNGDASSPHIYTIPLGENRDAQTTIQLERSHDNGSSEARSFDSTVRFQISSRWNALSSPTKTRLAQRHRVSEGEIDSYLRGEQLFTAAKLMAIRSDLLQR